MWVREDRAVQDAAVIDVGSNSVRLVLYRLDGRAIWTVFNEKVLAALGRDLTRTGRLSVEGEKTARAALRRFRAVLEGAGISHVFAVATAAVREAEDGPAFIAAVRADTGIEVRVLTGEEEARFSALGVLAGQPSAKGVAGDLGGSSLELVSLKDGKPGKGATLPLGPFALGAPGGFDPHALRLAVDAVLAPVAASFSAPCFYAVGGAWRNLSLLHMQLQDYPLRIVHQYEIGAREALSTARFVSHQSKTSLDGIEGVSRKRLETLPYAAVVLERLIERLGVERISMSAYGLREGLIFDAMPADLRALDPLVEGCAALGARFGIAERLGPALEAWLQPFWSKLAPVLPDGRDKVLMAAACRLADMGARLHPDHRADLVFDQVLRAPIAGQNHVERAFLATTLFARHTTRDRPEGVALQRVLDPDIARRARALGAALRLGCDLSGRTPGLLLKSRLTLERDQAVLTPTGASSDLLIGDQTAKRLSQLAALLNLEPKVAGA